MSEKTEVCDPEQHAKYNKTMARAPSLSHSVPLSLSLPLHLSPSLSTSLSHSVPLSPSPSHFPCQSLRMTRLRDNVDLLEEYGKKTEYQ